MMIRYVRSRGKSTCFCDGTGRNSPVHPHSSGNSFSPRPPHPRMSPIFFLHYSLPLRLPLRVSSALSASPRETMLLPGVNLAFCFHMSAPCRGLRDFLLRKRKSPKESRASNAGEAAARTRLAHCVGLVSYMRAEAVAACGGVFIIAPQQGTFH